MSKKLIPELSNGQYKVNGVLHREDGPADVETGHYWLFGYRISPELYEQIAEPKTSIATASYFIAAITLDLASDLTDPTSKDTAIDKALSTIETHFGESVMKHVRTSAKWDAIGYKMQTTNWYPHTHRLDKYLNR